MTIAYKPGGVTVTIGQSQDVTLPPRVLRARLTGMLFETDKTFVLPSAMNGIRELARFYQDHPGLKVLVTGHTDTVGGDDYNQGLSDERAQSVASYLSDDVDGWLRFYQGSLHSKRWGTREDQSMLTVLPQGGAPYYAGPITGVADAATRDAVSRFQGDHGLAVDGVAGPDTRRALVGDYMALPGTSLPPDAELATHGCGESHLAVETGDGVDEPANRRVEMFLFEGAIDPPPRTPCNRCPEYPVWVANTQLTVDLGLDAAFLDLTVADLHGQPMAQADVQLDGPVSGTGTTGSDGTARVAGLVPGSYQVTVRKPDFEDARFTVELAAGDAPSAPPAPAPAPSSGSSGALSFVGAPSQLGDGDSPGGGGTNQPAPGGSSGAQTGPNQAAATLISLLEVKITEFPTTLTDEARQGVSAGGAKPWANDTLITDFPVFNGFGLRHESPLDVDPADARTGHAQMMRLDQAGTLSLETRGLHAAPIVWGLDPSGIVGAGTPSPDTHQMFGRLRFSLWADPNNVTDANLDVAPGAQGTIDDISLLITVMNDTSAQLNPQWDVALAARGDSINVPFFQAIIDRCHQRKLQVLAGYGLVNTSPQQSLAFDQWLFGLSNMKDADSDTEATRYATALVAFLDGKFPLPRGFDGISFDIESMGNPDAAAATSATPLNAGNVAAVRPMVIKFYRAVAKELAKTNRICAVTVGGMMSDDSAALALPSVPNANVPALVAAQLNGYSMANGAPNLVMRVMSYDNAGGPDLPNAKPPVTRTFNHDPPQLEWHSAIIDYALKTKQVHPAQFQLGFKDFIPPGPSGQGGTLSEPGRILTRCKTILRDHRVGMALFAMNAPPRQPTGPKDPGSLGETWTRDASFNQALNADPQNATIPSATVGQPIHAPLDQASLDRLV